MQHDEWRLNSFIAQQIKTMCDQSICIYQTTIELRARFDSNYSQSIWTSSNANRWTRIQISKIVSRTSRNVHIANIVCARARVNAYRMFRDRIVIELTRIRNTRFACVYEKYDLLISFRVGQQMLTQFQQMFVSCTLHYWTRCSNRACCMTRNKRTNVLFACDLHDATKRAKRWKNVLFCVVTRRICARVWMCHVSFFRALHAHIRVFQHALTYKRCICVNIIDICRTCCL
jgi:hypothetical protein